MIEQAELNVGPTGEPQVAERTPLTPFATLRRFVKPRALVERCELCSAELSSEHQHLIEPATRKMICACQACAILFSNHAETKYVSVPRRIRHLAAFKLDDGQWESLLLPIGMAFFFYSTSVSKTVALYPSPAGATESLLDLDAWSEIVADNPVLTEMEPDTEALLVNRLKGSNEYYLVPIDECYRLVGLIRTYWHGLSGGQEVWEEIGKFFVDLKNKSRPAGAAQHA
jgi:hypothetical protein